jgi:hypothetical protein
VKAQPARELLADTDTSDAVTPIIDKRGEHAEPEFPGTRAVTPPDTPLFAGRPVRYAPSPE